MRAYQPLVDALDRLPIARRVAAHRTHVRRLDQVLRLLSNYEVEANVVDSQIREAVEGYVARSEAALERRSARGEGGEGKRRRRSSVAAAAVA